MKVIEKHFFNYISIIRKAFIEALCTLSHSDNA